MGGGERVDLLEPVAASGWISRPSQGNACSFARVPHSLATPIDRERGPGDRGGGSLFEDVHRRDWSLVMCQLQSGPPGVCGSTTGTNTPGSDRNTRKTGQRMLSAGDMAVSGL